MFKKLKQQITYIIYGNFNDEDLQIFQQSQDEGWLTVEVYTDENLVSEMKRPLIEGPISEILAEQHHATVKASINANQAILINAEQSNPSEGLDVYLNCQIELHSILLTEGCISIVDLNTATIYSSELWLKQVGADLIDGLFKIQDHIIITTILQDNGLVWMHSKGMIKFGKPELSIHDLQEEELIQFCDLFNEIAQEIVTTNTIPKHDQIVRLNHKLLNFKAYHCGSYSDEEFWNNVHIEFVPLNNAAKLFAC
jgi:hypothetical protein